MLRNLANRVFGDITLVFSRSEEYARNRLYILLFSIYANVVVMLYGGNFFTGLLLKLGADDAYMGAITIVTYAANIAAVFSPLIVERFQRRKRMLLVSRSIYYVLLLGFITIIPYLGVGQSTKLAAILSIIALVNMIASLTGSGMSVWHLQSLPEGVRSSFFANLNMIIGILNMVLLNLAGLFADYFKQRDLELLGIVLLRCAACLFAAIEIWSLSRIKEYPYPAPSRRISLPDILRIPLKNRKYLAVIAVIVMWTMASTIPGPFYQVYLLKDLRINYSFLSAVNLLNIPVLLIAMPVWGRLISRYGDVKLFAPLAAMISLHYLSLAFVTNANYQWLYPISVFYYFVLAAGITQVASLMPFKFIPETSQSNYISFYGAVNTTAALLGTLIGQGFILATEAAKMPIYSLLLGNKQLIMIVTAGAVLLGAVLMFFINRRLQRITG